MKTSIEEKDGILFATLAGEMDTAAAKEAEKVLQPLYKSDGRDVIIDCEGLDYIASSGLRILILILKGAKSWRQPCGAAPRQQRHHERVPPDRICRHLRR
jgi:anti-anti-sigma factor